MGATDVITGLENRCHECGSCIRVCPVKAINVTGRNVSIVEDKCIYCGRCIIECTSKAIASRSDIEEAKGLLKNHDIIAIISSEITGYFRDMDASEIEAKLLALGFSGVEDSLLGDEIVANEYLDYINNAKDETIIRSTCPAIVEMIEKFYPQLIPNLVPIVSPMIAQGRLVKDVNNGNIKTIFIGPCIAKKIEAERFNDRPIDLVLTFSELDSLFKKTNTSLEKEEIFYERPLLTRSLSVSEGFPRDILKNRSMIDNSFLVARGINDSYRLVESYGPSLSKKPRLLDLMACKGCISGPDMDENSLDDRVDGVIDEYKKRLLNGITFEEIKETIPKIELQGTFLNKMVERAKPTSDELNAVLEAGGKRGVEDELNCGSCGYDTCRARAEAVFQGLADWSLCFPYQKKIFEESSEQLLEMSVTDGLTGLLNHRAFLDRLKEETLRVKRYHSFLALIMIDVDNFKPINDTFGHLEGDRVLKMIANILSNNLRETDFAARYGGDEFALILPETKKIEAYPVAEKLRTITEGTTFFVGENHDNKIDNITLSLGICVIGEKEADPQLVISRADKAMYKAKEMGRNNTIISD